MHDVPVPGPGPGPVLAWRGVVTRQYSVSQILNAHRVVTCSVSLG